MDRRALPAIVFLGLVCTRCSCGLDVPIPDDDGAVPGADGSTLPGADGSALPGADGGPVACIDRLESISLSPATLNVTLDGVAAGPITFTAEGTFNGGLHQAIDPARLSWRAERTDDTATGTVTLGILTPNPSSGGVVKIVATDGCAQGSAEVHFFLRVVAGQPANPAPWGTAPTVATGSAPQIVYPSDQTRFPRNIHRTLFQWQKGAGTDFRLTFEGAGASVTVFTDGVHAQCVNARAAGCWEVDEGTWSFIAGSNAGGTVRWTVEGLDVSGAMPVIRKSPAITLGFSKRDVRGAIFYWSTTSAGIRRANIRSSDPEDYLTGKPATAYPNDTVQCVACHVISRNGRYLIAPVKSRSGDSLWVAEVTATAPPLPKVTTVADTRGHGFATISPDDATVVAAWKGKMWMLERSTGTKLADITTGMLKGTHPDWSPDNSQLVFATGEGDAPSGASIAVAPYIANTRRFGAAVVRVPAMGATNLFPMFSPAGDWIAYSRGRGGHDDLAAQLFMVKGTGAAGMPIELLRANRVVSNADTDGRHQNSQPTWAPPGDLSWIAFNSKREYGVVRPDGTQQIWIAAVDLSTATAGRDPSYPAFRLPMQGLDENNHRAFWSLDVRDEPPPDAGVGDAGDAAARSDAAIDDGGADSGRMCVAIGAICEPSVDECCGGGLCDTQDDGVSYRCIPNI